MSAHRLSMTFFWSVTRSDQTSQYSPRNLSSMVSYLLYKSLLSKMSLELENYTDLKKNDKFL